MGRLCNVGNFQVHKGKNADDKTKQIRDDYAKDAILMFYPQIKRKDLKVGARYWNLFCCELKRKKGGNKTKCWDEGFQILQNMQDRMTINKNTKQAKDQIIIDTEKSSTRQDYTKYRGSC